MDGVTTVKADLIQPGASAIAPKEPLRVSGLLDRLYEFDELTPALGRTYPTLQLRDLLHNKLCTYYERTIQERDPYSKSSLASS